MSPLVSILCVSHRPVFHDWLRWNVRKQSYQNYELILICDDETRVPQPVGELRNVALQNAKGSIVLWFDDDDWQHPRRVEWSVGRLIARPDEAWVSGISAWFLGLHTNYACRYSRRASPDRVPVHSLCAVRTVEAQRASRYDGGRTASDTRWVQAFVREFPRGSFIEEGPMSIWLCHARNLNPRNSLHWRARLLDVMRDVGPEAWGDTSSELEKLRLKVGEP